MKQSLAAKQVARKVLENVRAGRKPDITRLAIAQGYSVASANASKPQLTKTYQREINTALDKMMIERDRVLEAMSRKDISRERYDTLVRSASTLTHDTQLLSGGRTENVSVEEDRRILLGIVASLRSDTLLD